MVRYVNEDTMFKTSDGKEHLIRQGDRVAMYPPAIHKDPEIFEDPLVSIYIPTARAFPHQYAVAWAFQYAMAAAVHIKHPFNFSSSFLLNGTIQIIHAVGFITLHYIIVDYIGR